MQELLKDNRMMNEIVILFLKRHLKISTTDTLKIKR